MVHRVTVVWFHGGCCGGRMCYPKADYLEKVKAINSRLLGSRRERKSEVYSEVKDVELRRIWKRKQI